MWKRAQVLLCVGLFFVVSIPVLHAGPSPASDCRPAEGVVRIPTGSHDAREFLFTPQAHGTYLWRVPVYYEDADFILTRAGDSTVTVLGRTFPDFDLRVAHKSGGTTPFANPGDESGSYTDAEELYVYMPYGPDPIVIDDGRADGAAFVFLQCHRAA